VNCYEKNNYIVIEYKDNGPGVAEDKINKIFDLFYRADEARTSPHKGSGVGLAITKQIVELLNGNVTAENEGGLKIIISIPKEG
jgi:signal transduction histidine kinase